MLPVMYHKVNRKKRLRSPAKTGFRNFGFYRKIQLKNEGLAKTKNYAKINIQVFQIKQKKNQGDLIWRNRKEDGKENQRHTG